MPQTPGRTPRYENGGNSISVEPPQYSPIELKGIKLSEDGDPNNGDPGTESAMKPLPIVRSSSGSVDSAVSRKTRKVRFDSREFPAAGQAGDHELKEFITAKQQESSASFVTVDEDKVVDGIDVPSQHFQQDEGEDESDDMAQVVSFRQYGQFSVLSAASNATEAVSEKRSTEEVEEEQPLEEPKPRVMYFLGIIDILQEYNAKKTTEHILRTVSYFAAFFSPKLVH